MPFSPLILSGQLVIRGADSAPSGTSVATIKIVDRESEVLAALAIEVAAFPAAWTATIDPAFAADASKLRVWAMVRTEHDGVWGTPELVKLSEYTPITRIDGA